MEELSFRPAVEDDVPFLLELRRQTMDAHLVVSGVPPSVSVQVSSPSRDGD